MITVSEYDNRILAHVRSYPGVEDIEIRRGGKHRKLHFTYRDKPVTITLASTPSDVRAADNQISLITRMLGQPAEPEKREPRRLDDMAPKIKELQAEQLSPPSPIYRGSVALYATGRLRFVVPPEIAAEFTDKAVSVSRLDGYGWELRVNDKRIVPQIHYHPKENQHVLDVGADPALILGLEPFGSSPAEYLLEGGVVLVHAKGNRKPVTKRTQTHYVDDVQPSQLEVLENPNSKRSSIPTEAEMRAALAAVRRIESLTVYRIRRDKEGNVSFAAPRIE